MKSKALRMQFIIIGILLWVGIWLTGFNTVHWFLYLPATLLPLAGIIGICPGLIFQKMLFKEMDD